MQLAKRIKIYEEVFKQKLIPRMPAVIRVDGRAFHTLLKDAERPFDFNFATAMDLVAMNLVSEIQTARMAYVQSDEISILLFDYNKFNSEQWFGGSVSKIVSVSAAIATAFFNNIYYSVVGRPFSCEAVFDSRVFSIPERDVQNYFVQRQQDATRNSIQMLAQFYYSRKQLQGKNTKELVEMCWEKGHSWERFSPYWKRGRIVNGQGKLLEIIPILSKEPDYFYDNFLKVEEE